MSMKQTMCEFVHGMTCEEVSRFVGSIVRCRDCVYYIDSDLFYNPFCSFLNDHDTQPDGFCAWGERNAD